jgi:hypothetical protein
MIRVRVCVSVCVCLCVCVCVCLCVCVYSCLSYRAFRQYLYCAVLHCCLWPGCATVSHIIAQTARFSEKDFTEQNNTCFDFLYKFSLKHFSF